LSEVAISCARKVPEGLKPTSEASVWGEGAVGTSARPVADALVRPTSSSGQGCPGPGRRRSADGWLLRPIWAMLLKKSENALLRFFRKEAQLNFLAD